MESNSKILNKQFTRYHKLQKDFEGLFSDQSAALFDSFLQFQTQSNISGDFLEIGVYKGRSALMSSLHLRDNEAFYLVDLSYYLLETQDRLAPILGNRGKFYQKSSKLLTREDLNISKHSIRWIHIDGEHTGNAVWNDLSLCEPLLTDEGILILDDFFNPAYPQITEATYAFLSAYPYSLSLILIGWNKAYFSRPLFARKYLSMIRKNLAESLHQRDINDFIICKTTTQEETECFGICHRFQDRDYYGLDSNPDDLP